jgi:hypothetical protein
MRALGAELEGHMDGEFNAQDIGRQRRNIRVCRFGTKPGTLAFRLIS